MFDLKKIQAAISQIAAEKIAPEKLVEIIESAIKTAYKRDYATKDANVNVHLDMETGKVDISVEKLIVEDDEIMDEALEVGYSEIGREREWLRNG